MPSAKSRAVAAIKLALKMALNMALLKMAQDGNRSHLGLNLVGLALGDLLCAHGRLLVDGCADEADDEAGDAEGARVLVPDEHVGRDGRHLVGHPEDGEARGRDE